MGLEIVPAIAGDAAEELGLVGPVDALVEEAAEEVRRRPLAPAAVGIAVEVRGLAQHALFSGVGAVTLQVQPIDFVYVADAEGLAVVVLAAESSRHGDAPIGFEINNRKSRMWRKNRGMEHSR